MAYYLLKIKYNTIMAYVYAQTNPKKKYIEQYKLFFILSERIVIGNLQYASTINNNENNKII